MEGDLNRNTYIEYKMHFYPRPHMEGDHVHPLATNKGEISTHALTWRATPSENPYSHILGFLPTPSHGGRLLPAV